MDIDTRIRRAAPPPVQPSAELRQRVLKTALEQSSPARRGWAILLHTFAHYLVRYPIPMLTAVWLTWLISAGLSTPYGREIGLGQYMYIAFFGR